MWAGVSDRIIFGIWGFFFVSASLLSLFELRSHHAAYTNSSCLSLLSELTGCRFHTWQLKYMCVCVCVCIHVSVCRCRCRYVCMFYFRAGDVAL